MRMRFAVVGCGNIAPFYLNTLPLHPELELAGVADLDEERAAKLSAYYTVRKYESVAQVLDDSTVELVVNLTNPRSHYSVSKACLEAGKHVYSEKPLAMSLSEAEELVELAAARGLHVSCAPSRILAETGQTMWKALRDNAIGKPLVAYGEMDGGLIHLGNYKDWKNELGVPWPFKDEFEVGCTVEHAGYIVTLLIAYFGPIESVMSFGACQVPDKAIGTMDFNPPDLTVACIRFVSGMVARLTCSWIVPPNRTFTIFGDAGIMSTPDVWKPCSPVTVQSYSASRGRLLSLLFSGRKKYPFVRPPSSRSREYGLLLKSPTHLLRTLRSRLHHLRKRVDFCLGVVELASAVREKRSSRLSPQFCLHTTEVVLAIHEALESGSVHQMKTTVEPMEAMPWAGSSR